MGLIAGRVELTTMITLAAVQGESAAKSFKCAAVLIGLLLQASARPPVDAILTEWSSVEQTGHPTRLDKMRTAKTAKNAGFGILEMSRTGAAAWHPCCDSAF